MIIRLIKSAIFLQLCLVCLGSTAFAQAGKTYLVKSPDGKISITVNIGAAINWSVKHGNTDMILPSEISVTLYDGSVLGKNAIVKKSLAASVNNIMNTPIYKKDKITDNYNQLTLSFDNDYGLIFRAYNDGVAYRFLTTKKGDITIRYEEANFNFKNDDKAFLPFVAQRGLRELGIKRLLGVIGINLWLLFLKDFLLVIVLIFSAAIVFYFIIQKWRRKHLYRIKIRRWVFTLAAACAVTMIILLINGYSNKDKFITTFESYYDYINLSSVNKSKLAFLPVLIEEGDNKKAVILEADLQDYPGMYLARGRSRNLHGVFAPYPIKEHVDSLNYVVDKAADFIAKTSGTRSFPWRVVVISTADKQLADNDMMQRLGAPSQITDYSWIKPGKVAWDWWNCWNISHVAFKSGVNLSTYKYYIDFAAANKLEYVILDEGWSNIYDLNKTKIDLQQIIDYGKQKNIGIILWATWHSIVRDEDGLFKKFERMGVKGFKIDFICRNDQKMVKSLYQLAKKAADQHLVLDYHGMYQPGGMQRTYPNILNFEGVKGLENMKFGGTDNQPDYDVSIPFIRMVSGMMDYTPGAMRNATERSFQPVYSNPMSQGTRCHQLAMYVAYEAPLQMLADNPTAYMHEQESTDFIAAVPTTFDATVALNGTVGKFVCIARKKGTTWYAGAMTNWDPRSMSIDLFFLADGTYKATIFADGINCDRDAADYSKTVITVTAKDKLTIKMGPGGGWAARFDKDNF